jgi:hypothetical protein
MAEVYRDGVQMERCLFCGQAVRSAQNEPMAYLPMTDVAELCLLLEARCGDHPRALELARQLQHAVGQSLAQLQARADRAEPIPAGVRTDRGGLEQP